MGNRLDKPIIIGGGDGPSSSSSKLSVSLSSVAARKNSTSSFFKRPRFASSSLRLTSLSYHRNRRSLSSSSPSAPSSRIINNGAYFLRQIADNYHVRFSIGTPKIVAHTVCFGVLM